MKKLTDPLQNPAYKAPGLFEVLREAFLGDNRSFECAQIEVTSHCAGKCVYCPHTVRKEKWQARHMEAATFSSLWPILRSSSRAHLQGWGEPLLHPRFFDFVDFAKKAGCSVSTTSCGLGLNIQQAKNLVDHGLDLVAFSLVGTDQSSNSAREGVSFDDTCNAIKLLNKVRGGISGSNLSINLAYLLLADRVEAVLALPDLMERLDVETAVVSTLDFLASPEDSSLAFSPHEHEKIMHASHILEKVAEKAENLGRKVHYSLPAEEPIAHAGGCRENALRTIYINSEGDVSPCVYLNVPGEEERVKVFGNTREKNALKIWQDIDYVQFRNRLYSGHPDKSCLACPKRFEKIYL